MLILGWFLGAIIVAIITFSDGKIPMPVAFAASILWPFILMFFFILGIKQLIITAYKRVHD